MTKSTHRADPIEGYIASALADPGLLAWARQLLVDLCANDTSISADLPRLRAAEAACMSTYLNGVRPYLPDGSDIRWLPIPERLEQDPYFTRPYYAGTLAGATAAVYAQRHNLWIAPGSTRPGQRRWVLNAHLDTVPPHIPPRVDPDGRVVTGRGTVDNKGGAVLAAVVLRLLHGIRARWGSTGALPLGLLLSIDEESGGNGSLAAASQLPWADTTVVVLEPTRLRPHPANRGALWFQVHVSTPTTAGRRQLALCCAHIIRALTDAGQRLRQESQHPLFVPDDVQTCFGILGPYGEHPSSACTLVEVEAVPRPGSGRSDGSHGSDEDLQSFLMGALTAAARQGWIRRHPDAAAVEVHPGPDGRRVRVRAGGGHMGSRDRESDAILQAAEVTLALTRTGTWQVGYPGHPEQVTIEGGQGFLPSHTLDDVQGRLQAALQAALDWCRTSYGLGPADLQARIGFDKLHNAAYCSADDALGARSLAAAYGRLTGLTAPPLAGWQVSCDARIFARYTDDVVTFGAGALEMAHGPQEAVKLDEVLLGAGVVALAIQTAGAVASHD